MGFWIGSVSKMIVLYILTLFIVYLAIGNRAGRNSSIHFTNFYNESYLSHSEDIVKLHRVLMTWFWPVFLVSIAIHWFQRTLTYLIDYKKNKQDRVETFLKDLEE